MRWARRLWGGVPRVEPSMQGQSIETGAKWFCLFVNLLLTNWAGR